MMIDSNEAHKNSRSKLMIEPQEKDLLAYSSPSSNGRTPHNTTCTGGNHHNNVVVHDHDADDDYNHTALFFYVGIASMCSLLLGFDGGVMSGASIFIQTEFHLNDVEREILVGFPNLFAIVGSLVSGRLANILGRRTVLVLVATIFILGTLLLSLGNHYFILLFGRILIGFGTGSGLCIAPIYCAEISPPSWRGSLVSVAELNINIGILMGYLSNVALADVKYNWRIMVAIGIVPCLFILFGSIFIPESPRWYIQKGKQEASRRALAKVYRNPSQVYKTIDSIQESFDDSSSIKFSDLFRQNIPPTVMKALVIGLGLGFLQQVNGVDALVYYTPDVIKAGGLDNTNKIFLAVVLIGAVKTVGVLIAVFFLDDKGRRPLLLLSNFSMSFCLAMTAFLIHLGGLPLLVIAFLAFYNMSFEMGMGPITWLVCSEVLPLNVRAMGVSVAASLSRIVGSLFTLTFLSLSHWLSMPGLFLLLSINAALSFMFVFVLVPETKGVALEDMDQVLQDDDEFSRVYCDDDERMSPSEIV